MRESNIFILRALGDRRTMNRPCLQKKASNMLQFREKATVIGTHGVGASVGGGCEDGEGPRPLRENS